MTGIAPRGQNRLDLCDVVYFVGGDARRNNDESRYENDKQSHATPVGRAIRQEGSIAALAAEGGYSVILPSDGRFAKKIRLIESKLPPGKDEISSLFGERYRLFKMLLKQQELTGIATPIRVYVLDSRAIRGKHIFRGTG